MEKAEEAQFCAALHEAMAAAGYAITDAQAGALYTYYTMLIAWNEKMNLTAITDADGVIVKHFVDSATAWDDAWFPAEKETPARCSVLDVGTGAGFPGLVLAILHPSYDFTLIDALAKRVKFLDAVVRALGITNVTCVHARAEEAARDKAHRARYDVVVSRAVAHLSVLAEYTLPFLKIGGVFAALKGAKGEAEAADAARAVAILGGKPPVLVARTLPGMRDARAVLYIRKAKETPNAYPRKAGTPERKPLGM